MAMRKLSQPQMMKWCWKQELMIKLDTVSNASFVANKTHFYEVNHLLSSAMAPTAMLNYQVGATH